MKKKLIVIIICTMILIGIISGCVQEEETTKKNRSPFVIFTYEVKHNTSLDGGTVSFNSTATDEDNDTLSYLWDFDDGETSTIEDPIHVYSINGTYTVTLSVNDTKDETIKTETFIIGNIAPIAGFTWSAVNLTVTFTDASYDPNEDDLTYAWDFNEDGIVDNQTTGPVVYVYPVPGSYNIILKIVDIWGLVDIDTQLISVKESRQVI